MNHLSFCETLTCGREVHEIISGWDHGLAYDYPTAFSHRIFGKFQIC